MAATRAALTQAATKSSGDFFQAPRGRSTTRPVGPRIQYARQSCAEGNEDVDADLQGEGATDGISNPRGQARVRAMRAGRDRRSDGRGREEARAFRCTAHAGAGCGGFERGIARRKNEET